MYRIQKNCNDIVYWVNDSEGIPMEFETQEEAEKLKDIFQINTTHNSKYEVVKIV
jgi:hypothetical protein